MPVLAMPHAAATTPSVAAGADFPFWTPAPVFVSGMPACPPPNRTPRIFPPNSSPSSRSSSLPLTSSSSSPGCSSSSPRAASRPAAPPFWRTSRTSCSIPIAPFAARTASKTTSPSKSSSISRAPNATILSKTSCPIGLDNPHDAPYPIRAPLLRKLPGVCSTLVHPEQR